MRQVEPIELVVVHDLFCSFDQERMIAIQLQSPRKLCAIAIEEPRSPGPGEALVAVRRIGVCGTDWHSFAGRNPFFEYPRILGHELGVEILELGPDTPGEVGAKCSLEPYLNDPQSPASQIGKTNCCESLKVLGVHCDGGMCPRLLVPAHKLHSSSKLSFDALALVETLCIGAHGCERAEPKADDRILVVGAGPIGLSAYQFAHLSSEQVALMDVSKPRLDFARRQLGIDRLIHADANCVEEQVIDYFQGRPSLIIDATGHTGSMEQSFRLAGHGAKIVFLGIVQGNVSFADPEFHRRELTLLASRNAPASTFRHVMDQLEAGRIDTAAWITHRMTLEEVPDQLPPLEGADDLLKAMVEVPV